MSIKRKEVNFIKKDNIKSTYKVLAEDTFWKEIKHKKSYKNVKIHFKSNVQIDSVINVSFHNSIISGKIESKSIQNFECNDSSVHLSFYKCLFLYNKSESIFYPNNTLLLNTCKNSDVSFMSCELNGNILIKQYKGTIAFILCKLNIKEMRIEYSEISYFGIMMDKMDKKEKAIIDQVDITSSDLTKCNLESLSTSKFHLHNCNIDKIICDLDSDECFFVETTFLNTFTTSISTKYATKKLKIKTLSFLRCTFKTKYISSNTCSELLLFNECTFNKGIELSNYEKIMPPEVFLLTKILLLINSDIFGPIKLDISQMINIDFSGTKFLGYTNFNPQNFDLFKNKLIPNYKCKTEIQKLDNLKHQYWTLKNIFRKNNDIVNEDCVWIEYMRTSRKLSKWYVKPIYFCLDIIGRFGTDPLRIAISSFNTLVIWSFLYGLFNIVQIFSLNTKNHMFSSNIESVGNYLYFSTITFFTIGYGDIAPSHWIAKFLAGIEGGLGVFFIAYFTISLFKKFTKE